MRKFPKDNITELRMKRGYTGNHQRFLLQVDSFESNFFLPKPVEYEDIDNEFVDFVNDKIDLKANGEKVPTYTLFSNHRFTEFSQTFRHTDKEENLLMNFKTVGRETNVKQGTEQGNLGNIPGKRRYTVCIRTVLDDNGTEHYEVSSMEQPFAVDFVYTVSFVTSDFSYLNDFNMKVNELFKAKQWYIKPNGYEMPLYLDDISDESEYSIDNRKVYIQSATISLKGYVIPKDTLRIEKFPKRHRIGVASDFTPPKAVVEVEENEDFEDIVISFPKKTRSVSFELDEMFTVWNIVKENVRSFSISVDGINVTPDITGLSLSEGTTLNVRVIPVDFAYPSKLILTNKKPCELIVKKG